MADPWPLTFDSDRVQISKYNYIHDFVHPPISSDPEEPVEGDTDSSTRSYLRVSSSIDGQGSFGPYLYSGKEWVWTFSTLQ